jgi:hypothetical protein
MRTHRLRRTQACGGRLELEEETEFDLLPDRGVDLNPAATRLEPVNTRSN